MIRFGVFKIFGSAFIEIVLFKNRERTWWQLVDQLGLVALLGLGMLGILSDDAVWRWGEKFNPSESSRNGR